MIWLENMLKFDGLRGQYRDFINYFFEMMSRSDSIKNQSLFSAFLRRRCERNYYNSRMVISQVFSRPKHLQLMGWRSHLFVTTLILIKFIDQYYACEQLTLKMTSQRSWSNNYDLTIETIPPMGSNNSN